MRILIRSFGCSTNQADGSALAGCLYKAGYELADSVDDADVVILNTCAVKGPTENRVIDACRRLKKEKKLIIAGCLPLINFERLQEDVRFDAAVGPALGESILEVVKRVSNGEKIVALEGSLNRRPSLNLPRVQTNPVVSVIPTCYGCSGSCSYCCVVFARGRLRSHPIQEVVERVHRDLKDGFREFWLTAQDTGSYGRDIGTNLTQLLRTICTVEGDFTIRVGMMTPNSIMDILDELIEAIRNEKIFKFLHLPVQSGNDHVLRQMFRFYSASDFRTIVQRARKSFPSLSIATDVICGFPGENENAFKDTLKLIEEIEPDVVNVSKFFARPKTYAAEMEDKVSPSEIKRRSGVAAALSAKTGYERNRLWVGWKGKILIDEVGKVQGSLIGRNFAYKPIVIRSADNLLGKTCRVEIVKAFPTYLAGEIAE